MQKIYRYEFTVPEEARDQNGHVNNVEYLRWMQNAAMKHSDTVGCTQATEAAGATWVVRAHKIEYFKPAYAGDRIVVETWIADFRRVQSLRKYKILRLPDMTVLAEGETSWVFVDAQKGSLRSIPKEVRAMFEPLQEVTKAQIIGC